VAPNQIEGKGLQMSSSLGIIALTAAVFGPTFSIADVSIALAAARAGAVGVINVEFVDTSANDTDAALASLVAELAKLTSADRCGIKCDISQVNELKQTFNALSNAARGAHVLLSLAGNRDDGALPQAVSTLRALRLTVLVEATDIGEARLAHECAADAVVAKGHEGGGRIGEQTSFVLLQQCVSELNLPVWVEGGIGLHTAAACLAAGATGVVLSSQLLSTQESPLALAMKQKIAGMDGTETQIVGDQKSGLYRVFSRHPSTGGEVEPLAASVTTNGAPQSAYRLLKGKLLESASNKPLDRIYAFGQDVAFAADLTRRFGTVAGIIQGIRESATEHVRLAAEQNALCAGSALAKSHGTTYPIVQGAMTRVSDTADFALKVAENGALPFLALALMRKDEVDALTCATKEKLGQLPWGVGILGFVPQQLRQEQLDVIRKYKPPFALIAGGRPDQAKVLEEIGTKTYLHVPSPMLLESFIEMGSRRFIFEGKECGGHVGPRSSFILWEAMIEKLLSSISPKEDATTFHVLFAGGVHDGLSATMVAAMAAPLVARGVRVGALMGTAYLFTKEAVQTGAIVKKFQDAALQCADTVLLETGPGHAIRCIDSPYKRTFDSKRQELVVAKKSRDEIREELEFMNLGRLRIASKGLTRTTGSANAQAAMAEFAANQEGKAEKKDSLATVGEHEQWADGMYMIGQVAAMHDKVCTMKELHEEVASGSSTRLQSLAQKLAAPHSVQIVDDGRPAGEPVALVGMSCLFPGATDVATYWENILSKVDAITEVPEDHWDWKNYYDKDPLARDKIMSKWGGFLGEVKFDSSRYGIPPSSMKVIDPMQLLLLDVTRAALEDAGYFERAFARPNTSVILANAGHGPITAFYNLRSMLGWKLAGLPEATKKQLEDELPEWSEDTFPGYLGNVAAGRVANRFDLGGVNFTVDAACGSSLAALYVAVSELRNRNSDVVLLGAADTHNQPGDYLSFSKTHAFSGQGRCRTFDATADGIVISEGIAMVVLKRLADAERDGDRIYAVIRGIGGSSDGRDLSLTAPRPAGQMLALRRAYQDAGVTPNSVTLVEAHGTGTVAGDKAEIEALKQVFDEAGTQERSCAVGSVKTMIGHTKCAAGLASLIKVAKALHHKVLPPTIGVTAPNPTCNFERSPFYINSEARPWVNPTAPATADGQALVPRRAGVSAFGFGGTNFHAVLEEYVPAGESDELRGSVRWASELFILRSRSRAELVRSIDALIENAKKWGKAPDQSKDALRLLAYSNYIKQLERHTDDGKGGGEKDPLSLSIVAISLDDLMEKLTRAKQGLQSAKDELRDPRGVYLADLASGENQRIANGKVAFLFSGQGSQQVDMVKDITCQFDEARETFEIANAALRGRLAKALTEYIYPPPTFTDADRTCRQQELTDTQVAQPAVGAADMAMFKLLSALGVKPHMTAGHSYGEYVALCAAGAMSETDLYRISEQRGRILSQSNGDGRGSMAAFACNVETAEKILAHCPGVTLANINSPTQCVVSGEHAKIEAAVETAKKAGVQAKEIAVSQAFHSSHMAHAQAPLKSALQQIALTPPTIPVFCNTDGQIYAGTTTEIVDRLTAHIVRPVNFVGEVLNMQCAGATIFVEVGPGSVLGGLTEAILQPTAAPYLMLSCDRAGRNGITQLQHTLAQLAAYGLPIDLERLFAGRITALECLNLKNMPVVETAGNKRGLTYMVNSYRVRRVGAPEAATASASKATQSSTRATATHSSNTGAPVTSQLKPTNSNSAPGAEAAATAPRTPGSPEGATQRSLPSNGGVPQIAQPATGLPALPSPFNGAGVQMPNLAGRNVDQVMMQFQQTMLQMTNSFLETQQKVMLAYLGAKTGATVPQSAMALNQQLDPRFLQPEQGQPVVYQSPQQYIQMPQQAVDAGSNGAHEHDAPHNGNGHGNGNGSGLQQAVADHVAAPSDAPASVSSDSDPEQLIAALLEIVSERTGYPPEMLDPALDLEADLGIDSIKRVEILNSFRKILPEQKQLQLESGIEELAGTKTLQGIMDWLRADAPASAPIPGAEEMPAPGTNGNGPGDAHVEILKPTAVKESHAVEPVKSSVGRAVVQSVELSPPMAVTEAQRADGVIIVIDDERGLAAKLANSAQVLGSKIVLVQHKEGSASDLMDESKVNELVAQWKSTYGKVAGVISLLAFHQQHGASLVPLYTLFQLAKSLEPELNRKEGQTLVAAAHQIDGAFGHLTGPKHFAHAGIAGLLKSLDKEWANARCKSIDFPTTTSADDVVGALLFELTHDDARVEAGYAGNQRHGLQARVATIHETSGPVSSVQLDQDSVVVITGGARGITAEIAQDIASAFRPKLIVIGRTARPTESESDATSHLTSAKEIKSALIEQLKSEQKPVSVSAVETTYQKLMRDREISSNLSTLERLGATVEYHALDVRDEQKLGALIDSIYATHGRIDGVVHGAGIIEDAYTKDKTLESFRRVVETKVLSAVTLGRKLKLDSLKFMFLFSSVVGRTGNAGQTDYVSANEIINKLALTLNEKTPGRVASLMWGPWRGGMAQPELESIFHKYGWAMIDPLDGRRAFMNELLHGRKDEVEVLLVAEVAVQPQPRGPRLHEAAANAVAPGVTEFSVALGTDSDLYLSDHTFDGVPVMPMAMSVELMMEAAESALPGWRAVGVYDMDIPAGIVFEGAKKTITVRTEILSRSESDIVVAALLGVGAPMKRTNFKARVRLIKEGASAAAVLGAPWQNIPATIDLKQEAAKIQEPLAAPPTVQHVYGNWLFHGPLFQGIKEIHVLGAGGVFGEVQVSDPKKCLQNSSSDSWSIDPILLDSSMQLAGAWARQYLDITALPTGFRALHRFAPVYSDRLHVRVYSNPGSSAMEITCNLAAYNDDGTLAFVMERLGGVGSKSLNRLSQTAATPTTGTGSLR
jgi:acyl transferase domain-containing protein/NAD(P)H-dependent flavin oxidoreductase YrpB (nitropropane dioxygenase family)